MQQRVLNDLRKSTLVRLHTSKQKTRLEFTGWRVRVLKGAKMLIEIY